LEVVMRGLVMMTMMTMCLLPALAFAQPADPAAPPAGDPAAPAQVATPAGPPPGPPIAKPAMMSSARPSAPPSAPQVVRPQPSLHNGMTVELSFGIGWIVTAPRGEQPAPGPVSPAGLAGLDLGIGEWATPRFAVTVRVVGVAFANHGNGGAPLTSGNYSGGYFIEWAGPSWQYWANQHVWFGGGIGVGGLRADLHGDGDRTLLGFEADLRAGYTFTEGSENTINVSFELTPGYFTQNSSRAMATGIALLFGYQHL
jgi:hypothetical protein